MHVSETNEATIADAGSLLAAGRLVAFPTETVYGLGADATNSEAVAAIFAAKGRPQFNPLIVHVADLASAERLAVFSPAARRLADAFWPGPLTLVLKRAPACPVSDLATAGLDTIAIRVPAHPVALRLLRAAGCPVAAPSANRSGHVSPTTARHVATDLGGRVAMILDGGAADHGLESTVIDASGGELALLRPGAITLEVIEAKTGLNVRRSDASPEQPTSPGQLASHYAPRARLTLNARVVPQGEAQLAFGPALPSTGMIINLSPNGDLIEAAAGLFAALRAFDEAGATAVSVMPIPADGLGEAINDRLMRAAAPRGA